MVEPTVLPEFCLIIPLKTKKYPRDPQVPGEPAASPPPYYFYPLEGTKFHARYHIFPWRPMVMEVVCAYQVP